MQPDSKCFQTWMPLGNSRQRCCQGGGCTKQLCLFFPGCLPLQELVHSCSSQPFQHVKPHNQFASTECTTQTASCCSPLLIREMEENGHSLWGNLSQNSPAKPFHFISLKINKGTATIINNLVEISFIYVPHIVLRYFVPAGEDALTNKGDRPK